ncbi:MAG TPA: heavy metal-associated domain-containing protein [Pirellulales bacterium]|nr:heavy metal-associated domain-containing protein [Pirellulales bacterium]
MHGRRLFWVVACSLYVGSFGLAADQPPDLPTTKHQVTGLFSKERVPDLEKIVRQLSEIELVRVDFATAEAEFRYDIAKVFPNATPEQIVERLDQMLRNASRHTFGIKPLCATPREELERVEIPVLGLDCKACCLAAYEAIYKLEGVEQATASFKEGLVVAWIHPGKTDVKMLETALKQRNVTLKESARP